MRAAARQLLGRCSKKKRELTIRATIWTYSRMGRAHENELAALRLAWDIEAARELGNQRAFDSVREIEVMLGPNATAEEIQELARLGSASFGHPVGTCKMGVDKLAVVDAQLRVHGLAGLRVADASVMPRIITGPTNAPTHMIAGRASRLILGQ